VKPASLKRQTSSGGVIYRKTGAGFDVALVSVKGGRYWCLPKGLVDKGETPELTALREVREESGLTGRIIDKLGDITYWYFIQDKNIKCRKTVHFFLMEYVEGDTSDHDLEVDDAEWFPIETALNKISYRGDRGILEKASSMLANMNVP
jgi:8-oxo-dGTP pyrophosphatase MutT (NUDIX family)